MKENLTQGKSEKKKQWLVIRQILAYKFKIGKQDTLIRNFY